MYETETLMRANPEKRTALPEGQGGWQQEPYFLERWRELSWSE